jgi:dCMP deaminase
MALVDAERDAYFMRLAQTIAAGGDCTFLKVGVVLARDDTVLASGHLGTPQGVPTCAAGGCPACASGQALSVLCTCIHAETAALMAAARNGVAVAGATCYGTHRACLECLKQLIQAGVRRIVYATARPRDAEYLRVYDQVVSASGMRIDQAAPLA